jgi:soluble lytic murein transglycosylase-like protein
MHPRAHPFLLAALLSLSAPAVAAGIFSFVDEDGVENLTNVPDSRRYRLVLGDVVNAGSAARRPRTMLSVPAGQRPFHQHVLAASQVTGVDAALLHAVISVESGYDQRAISRKGASGLMQLMPATAARYGIRDILDPQDNIRAGAHYLRDLLSMFDNDVELALAAYNAGEQAVIRHGRRLPPYAETRRYVPMVIAHYQRLSAALP